MPTYQYACTVAHCGHQFDTVQAFSDSALTECPECAGRLRKVWGSIGVVFKGSGFYRNDSRESSKNGKKDAAESPVGSKSSSDTSASTPAKSTSESGSSTPSPAKRGGESSSTSTRAPAAAAS